ncbi:MAG TPA: antirestriction protein [Noviherbaspirillum sp.]|nr:antirestriction protein [Noviherbaspirillum sp.]
MCATAEEIVTATLVPEVKRLGILPKYFGERHMLKAEATVYNWMSMLASDYIGGYWNYYELSNGGFYMAPTSPERFDILVDSNGYSGEMSADAAGITACLFAFCNLANYLRDDRIIDLYHQLRDFAATHPEGCEIFRAID